MDAPQTIKAVQILIEDGHLFANWTQLADILGQAAGDQVILENQYKQGTITPYNLLKEILTQWRSAKGAEATIAQLADTLQNLNFKSAAGE
jgi:hypothetical protein